MYQKMTHNMRRKSKNKSFKKEYALIPAHTTMFLIFAVCFGIQVKDQVWIWVQTNKLNQSYILTNFRLSSFTMKRELKS